MNRFSELVGSELIYCITRYHRILEWRWTNSRVKWCLIVAWQRLKEQQSSWCNRILPLVKNESIYQMPRNIHSVLFYQKLGKKARSTRSVQRYSRSSASVHVLTKCGGVTLRNKWQTAYVLMCLWETSNKYWTEAAKTKIIYSSSNIDIHFDKHFFGQATISYPESSVLLFSDWAPGETLG